MRYCDRHRISYDWMLGGCLKGFKKMVDERRVCAVAASPSRLGSMLARLSETEHQILIEKAREMLPVRRQ